MKLVKITKYAIELEHSYSTHKEYKIKGKKEMYINPDHIVAISELDESKKTIKITNDDNSLCNEELYVLHTVLTTPYIPDDIIIVNKDTVVKLL